MGLVYNLFNKLMIGASRLVGEPIQYARDGLFTVHNAEFLSDPRFREAYRLGIATGPKNGSDPHIEWRVYLCCWAASIARHLDGDFVECGVNTGILSRSVVQYAKFDGLQGRTFYLMDTFEGIPKSQFVDSERAIGLDKRYTYGDTYAEVLEKFSAYPNVKLIKGRIPESLAQVTSKAVAYLSIDMNAVVPEIAAIEYFWPRLVRGAIVVLDDYNWRIHVTQKRAFDEFASRNDTQVLALPTGQGLLVKT